MSKQTIGFIGLGLIGGSIAKALRAKHPDLTLIAYNRSKDSLIEAMADGTINQAMDTIGPGFSDCDIIFLCAPVSVNIRCLEQLKPAVPGQSGPSGADCSYIPDSREELFSSIRRERLSFPSHFYCL